MRARSNPDSLLMLGMTAVIGTAPPALRAQPCQPFWTRGAPVLPHPVIGPVAFDDGSGPALYAIGSNEDRPFRWREGETQWTAIFNGLPFGLGLAPPLLVLDDGSGPGLYALGNIQIGGPIQYATVRWNGATSSWELPWPITTGTATFPYVSADLGDGMTLYGIRDNGNLTESVVKRVGDQWELLGGPVNGPSHLVTYNDGTTTTLYLCGGFTSIGGIPISRFARWTGTQWVQAGDNPSISLDYGVAFDDGTGPALYGTGGGTFNGQSYFGALLRFDGQHWSLLGFGDQTAIYTVNTLDLFDDGFGPAIYIGGSFSGFEGVPAHDIARYDGHTWSTLRDGVEAGGVGYSAQMHTSRGPTLFVFGPTQAGGGIVNGTAAWVGCPNCYANCDNSTAAPRLNVLDFICFLNRFAAQDPYANCDGSTTAPAINISDFICFLNKFAAGCP